MLPPVDKTQQPRHSVVPVVGTQNQDILPAHEYQEPAEVKELPSWCESLIAGAKIAGLGLGAAVCGAFATILLPLSITGIALIFTGDQMEKGAVDTKKLLPQGIPDRQAKLEEIRAQARQGKRLTESGMIVALHVIGLVMCILSIRNIVFVEQAKHFAHEAIVSKEKKDQNRYINKFRNAIKDMPQGQREKIGRYVNRISKEHKVDELLRNRLLLLTQIEF